MELVKKFNYGKDGVAMFKKGNKYIVKKYFDGMCWSTIECSSKESAETYYYN